MKLQLIDKELTVELEANETLEWDGNGKFRVHPKLVRAADPPIIIKPKFDGVIPEMKPGSTHSVEVK